MQNSTIQKTLMQFKWLTAIWVGWCAAFSSAQEMNCLTESEGKAADYYFQLQQDAYELLAKRKLAIEKLKTPEQINAHQKRLKKFFVDSIGGFPERTPLNPIIVRKIKVDGYRIENVIFESQPNHRVTANFYIPDGKGPFPCVVVSSGHSRTGKTADYNQRFGISMAKHGMAAFCFDPIGQGERSQIIETGKPKFGSTTSEHFLIGVGSILVGKNTATYRIWDAMRAIDYVCSRSEIDANKIGYTGCSGGGTLTSYVMALDDRVACAAPACYLTTFRRLIETLGPQDSEQNIFGQLGFGMDHPDYVLMRAPKPTLISSTTSDFFDISGSWENLRQSKRIYGKLGFPERVDLVEIEGSHGVQPQNLATITHWMQRWLLKRDDPVEAKVYKARPEKELWCTNNGQVMLLEGERSVFDLNYEFAKKLEAARQKKTSNLDATELRHQVANCIGVSDFEKLGRPEWIDRGRVKKEDFDIDRLVLKTAGGTLLPGLTFHPREPSDEAYLYLHEDGKLADSEKGGPIQNLVSDGFAVVTLDLRGQGELSSKKRDPVLGNWKTYYLGYLLGRSMLGPRVKDAKAGADFVAFYQRKKDNPRDVHLVGVGQAGIVALHVAALYPERFASITLRDVPDSWISVVRDSSAKGQLDSAVHGVLRHYDLPDLIRLVGKEKVKIETSK